MEELQTLRTALERYSVLEAELAEAVGQVKSLQQDLQRLKRTTETIRSEADSLAAPGLKGLFLKLTGKQETAIIQARQEVRAAESALAAADFQLQTTQAHMTALTDELAQTASCEASYLARLTMLFPDDPRMLEAQSLLDRLHQREALLCALREAASALKPLLQSMIRLYETGDIQTDLVGRRYDNKFPTMREKAIPCQAALNSFTALLLQYAAAYGLEFGTASPGPWSSDPKYLTAPAFDAKELFERIDDVRCWLRRLESRSNEFVSTQKAQDRCCRQALYEILFTAHDSLMRKAAHL